MRLALVPKRQIFVGIWFHGNRLWQNNRLQTCAANVAELVDALDLGSSGGTRGSSSLPIRTRIPVLPGGLELGPAGGMISGQEATKNRQLR
jgi:hypothetical protein